MTRHPQLAREARTIVALAFAMTLMCPLVGLAQSIGKAHGPERCSEKIKFDKLEDFDRLAVDSKLEKIIRELQFSQKDFDLVPFDKTEDLASQAYGAAFLISRKGDKEVKDAKANLFAAVHKNINSILKTSTQGLSPKEQITVQALMSKIISLVSKAFDLGREDGGKPCPKLRRPM